MSNLFEKLLYTGIGLAATANETVQNRITDLMAKQEPTTEKGKAVFENLSSMVMSTREKYEDKFNTLIHKTVNTINMPTQVDMDALLSKITDLETEIETLVSKTNTTTKTTTEDAIKVIETTTVATTTSNKTPKTVK